MTQRDLFVDAFDLQTVAYEIHEAASQVADDSPNAGIVDGENILARVVGTFFLVDGKSRNGRFYTKQLWETAIKRTNDRMSSGQMLGTIGHSQPLDDAALLQGLASHRVARLWIDDKNGVGMGEILVLNTPSGRVLNAYLRGGVKFPVSSRGYGGFRNGKRDGAPIIDEDTFELETFDFVRVPGVAIALPQLVESLDTEATELYNSISEELSETETQDPSQLSTTTTFEERVMSNETAATISALARQKAQVEDDLTTAYSENETLRGKNETLEADNKVSTNRIAELETTLAEAQTATATFNNYQALGTVEAIQEVFKRYKDMSIRTKELSNTVNENAGLSTELETYKVLGSVEEINTAMDIAEKLMSGAEDTVLGAADLAEQLTDLGSPEEIAGALDMLEAYASIATPAELEEATSLLGEYIELGSVSEVHALIERSEQMAESLISQKQHALVEALAAETNQPKDVVSDLVESLGEDGARSILGRLGATKVNANAVVEADEVTVVTVTADDDVDEDTDDVTTVTADDVLETELDESFENKAPTRSRAGSLTEALMEQFSTLKEDSIELSEEDNKQRVDRYSTAGRVGGLFESCGG
jgi:hypothetical protein